MHMRALKSFSYNTRRLLPGDHFETKRDIDARLLEVNKRAERLRQPGKLPAPPASLATKVPPAGEDISALRNEYAKVMGKRPFNGWDAETLKAKMAEAD